MKVWLVVTGLVVFASAGCALVGPTCVSRQQRGPVAAVSGEIAAGQMVSHRIRYDTRGSQNDATVSWDDDRSSNPPRLRFFATPISCADFQRPPGTNTGDCRILASAGWTSIGIATTLIVTHGRGNPEVLGTPPEYKIWVVGDDERSARYSIDISYFFGPDC